jgi:gliding motility-associated-like protein
VEKPILTLAALFSIDCANPSVGLDLTVAALASGFSFDWSGPGAFSSQLQIPSANTSGTYTVTVTSTENGCSAETSTEVDQSSGITSVGFSVSSPDCTSPNATGTLMIGNVQGGIAPFQYSIDGVQFSSDKTFGNLASGGYQLTVRDAAGCLRRDSFTVKSVDVFELDLGIDLDLNLGDSVQLSGQVIGTAASWLWTPAATLSCTDCPNPIAKPAINTLYIATIINPDGCTAADSLWVRLKVSGDIVYTPNAFGPGFASPNDYFMLFTGPIVQEIKSFQVFDRWGDAMFSREKPTLNVSTEGWNGKYKDKVMLPGVYFYAAELILLDGSTYVAKGSVTLIR